MVLYWSESETQTGEESQLLSHSWLCSPLTVWNMAPLAVSAAEYFRSVRRAVADLRSSPR